MDVDPTVPHAAPSEHGGTDGVADGLIDAEFARASLTADDRWCRSHGALEGTAELGSGLLYYSLAYALRASTCVCLGSGGGFVPRLMRQAQRDLRLEGSRTILVDGVGAVGEERRRIWGSPSWTDPGSALRRLYPDVELRLQLTADAFRDYFEPEGISIDYLHIDADHHYDGVRQDWDLYRTLVPPDGIITLHDTVNYREPCGVPQLVEEIRADPEYELVNLPMAYGLAIVKRVLGRDENIAAARSGVRSVPGWRQ